MIFRAPVRSRALRRRFSLAVAVSLGLHVVVGALVVGSSLWNGWPVLAVDVEITGMRLEDLQDLPLGAPAGAANQGATDVTAPPPAAAARPRPRPKSGERGALEKKDQADRQSAESRAEADAGTAPSPRPSSVRSYAPEGSRVTALLRLDRLRATPYASPVDAVLLHLPDRRDLLEGTGIDLYRDIDALLIATPNPLDARLTLLAARHRLSDGALRTALERGARATGRKLSWRTERGRPFAERRSAVPLKADPAAATTNRDQRLILLAAPNLVVVTPPAYRSLILRGRAMASAPASGAAGGNGGGFPDGGAPAADAGAVIDGGGSPAAADDGTGWATLLRRIDAEDSILPADAVAMVSAVDLFSARALRPTLDTVPGTRGAVDDDVPPPVATVMGLPVPRMVTATLGITPQPFADVEVQFASDGDAARWEQEWPLLRRRLLNNPLVVLSGFSALIGRATLAREAATIRLRIDATEFETTRILQIAAAQLTAMGR